MAMINQQNRGVEAQETMDNVRKVAETSPLTTNQFNTLLDNKANDAYFNFGEIAVDNENYTDSTIEEMKRREIEMTNKKKE